MKFERLKCCNKITDETMDNLEKKFPLLMDWINRDGEELSDHEGRLWVSMVEAEIILGELAKREREPGCY